MNRYQSQFKIFNKTEKAEIEEKLHEQFGIKKINGTILQSGADRLFLYQGQLTEKQIQELEQAVPIERVGIYFAKIQNENETRLSIDGVQLFQHQITKNIFEVNQEQANQWMHGNELNIKTNLTGFIVIKFKNNFLGCGKASEEKITNFIPKNRRLKEKN